MKMFNIFAWISVQSSSKIIHYQSCVKTEGYSFEKKKASKHATIKHASQKQPL